MSIKSLITDTVDTRYLTHTFRKTIEDHLSLMRQNSIYSVPVTTLQQRKYRGDFEGLALELNVRPDHIWATMRVNGILSSQDYEGNTNSIYLVDPNVIDAYMFRSETLLRN